MPWGCSLFFASLYHQKMVSFNDVADKTVRRLQTSGRFFYARVTRLAHTHHL